MGCGQSAKVEDYVEGDGDKSILSQIDDNKKLQRAISDGSFIFAAETADDTKDDDDDDGLHVTEHIQDGVTYWVQCIPEGQVFADDDDSERDDPDIIGKWDNTAKRVILFTDAVVEQRDQLPEMAKRSPRSGPTELSTSASELTLWVGGVPESSATEEALKELFTAYGAIESVTVRVKETAEHGPNKSWALVTFVDEQGAAAAQSAEPKVTSDGEEITLKVKETSVESELSKPSTGALATIWKKHTSFLEAALEQRLNIEAATENESVAYGAGTTVHKLEEQLSVDSGNDHRRANTRSNRHLTSGSQSKKGGLRSQVIPAVPSVLFFHRPAPDACL